MELRYKTYTLPMQVEVAYRTRIDALRARCEQHGVDFWGMWNQGIPTVLDDMERAMNALPAQSDTPIVVPKRRGRWNKTQPTASGLEDLAPPGSVANGADNHTDTGEL
jgi:hypothetical protein